MTTTNKFGSMLLELRDPQTPEARVNEIARLFNEFSEREERYKSTLGADGSFHYRELHVESPIFSVLPNRLISFRDASQSVPNATWTRVHFPNVRGRTVNPEGYACVKRHPVYDGYLRSDAYVNDKNMLVFFGRIVWPANSTGERTVEMDFFDKDGNDLGFYAFNQNAPVDAFGQEFIVTDYLLAGQFVEVFVWQNSGGALTLAAGDFTVFLA